MKRFGIACIVATVATWAQAIVLSHLDLFTYPFWLVMAMSLAVGAFVGVLLD